MTTLEQTQAAIEEMDRRKAALVATLTETGARLAELEERLGDDFLDGNATATQRTLLETRAQFDALNSAVTALARRKAAAEIDLQRATAADRRRQASEKKTQLDKLNRETAKLLLRLGELEHVEYSHSILSSMPRRGAWHSIESGSVTHDVAPWKSVLELDLERSDFGGKISIPLSRKLRMEIEELEHQAQQIEHKLPADPERAIEQVA